MTMDPTPNGSHIYADHVSGLRHVEITEEVQVIYDLVLSSMDFGSGFLTIEDIKPLKRLAQVCGFDESALHLYIKRGGRFYLGARTLGEQDA